MSMKTVCDQCGEDCRAGETYKVEMSLRNAGRTISTDNGCLDVVRDMCGACAAKLRQFFTGEIQK